MRRLIAFLSTISIFAAMAACTPEENTNSKELTVTGTAMDIGITTVKITAYANLPIELGDAVFGVVCSENPSPSNKNGIMVQATRTDANNMYSVTIKGLSPNTKYYYASFVKNGRVYQYGEVKSFTTQDISASVSTEAATGIRLFEATISGKLTVESREVLPRSVWFLYSTSAESLEDLKSSGTRADAHIGNDGAFFTYVLSSPNYNTTYYYVACAKVHNNEYYGEVKCFTTLNFKLGAVDLGLSVKWRGCNIGASKAEEYGDYFAWGETETKDNYSWETYKWCDGTYNSLTKYNTSASYGTVDNKTVLEAEDDVAHVKLGDTWRIPTIKEVEEIKSTMYDSNYQWEWKSINGHNGWLVTCLVNSNFIFLPAAGCRSVTSLSRVDSHGFYWSSSLNTTGYSYYAWRVRFIPGDFDSDFTDRYYGVPVRPVTE